MKTSTLTTASLAITLSACAVPAPTYKPPPRYTAPDTDPVKDLEDLIAEYDAGRIDPSMIPDTPEEIADQETSLALMDEADAIRNKPMSELTMADTSRLRSIDREIQQMRMKYITSERSADHLSEYGLKAAKEGRLE